jgi:hypothetical protein
MIGLVKGECLMNLFMKKDPFEACLKSYGVIYLSGHPFYPEKKPGDISFNIFSEISIPTTDFAPFSMANRECHPKPQPKSKTLLP